MGVVDANRLRLLSMDFVRIFLLYWDKTARTEPGWGEGVVAPEPLCLMIMH